MSIGISFDRVVRFSAIWLRTSTKSSRRCSPRRARAASRSARTCPATTRSPSPTRLSPTAWRRFGESARSTFGRSRSFSSYRRDGRSCRTTAAAAYDDPAFQQMLDAYGGLAAQIVTPVLDGDRLKAVVSLHQLGQPRTWTPEEIAAATEAAGRVAGLL